MANPNYVLTRVKPADIYELIQKYGGDASLTTVFNNLVAAGTTGDGYSCLQCVDTANENQNSGWVTIQDPVSRQSAKVICNLCLGITKTSDQYTADEKTVGYSRQSSGEGNPDEGGEEGGIGG